MAGKQRRFKHTPEQIKAALTYNPETGALLWRPRPSIRRPCQEARFAGQPAGGVDGPYLAIRLDGEKYRAHQLAWCLHHGEWPKNVIDHINGDGSDNRISNLRDVTCGLNTVNKHTPVRATSGFRGVAPNGGKWEARLGREYLGLFATAEAASLAYKKAVAKAFQQHKDRS